MDRPRRDVRLSSSGSLGFLDLLVRLNAGGDSSMMMQFKKEQL